MTGDERSQLAHDLKTPLAVIAGYAELLAARDDEETRVAASEQILEAAGRLREAIDSLLGISTGPAESRSGLAGEHPASTTANGRPARVVVIDDDVFVRRLLRQTLPTDEFEIAEASDGDVALAIVEAQSPQLVLLDWRMPRLQGDEVLRTLKERDPKLPVIVLTADRDQRAIAESLGADLFLTKPFSPVELLENIGRLVAERATDESA